MEKLTATVGDVTFALEPHLTGFRWHFPNGQPTDIYRDTAEEAVRAMAFRGSRLAREWKNGPDPKVDENQIALKAVEQRAEEAERWVLKLSDAIRLMLERPGSEANARSLLAYVPQEILRRATEIEARRP